MFEHLKYSCTAPTDSLYGRDSVCLQVWHYSCGFKTRPSHDTCVSIVGDGGQPHEMFGQFKPISHDFQHMI